MEGFFEKIIDMCTVEDLMRGYIYDEAHRIYICLYCGDTYDEDLIYNHDDKLCSARRAVEIHISEAHKSSFDFLVGLEKKYTGLTDRQVEIFNILYNENDNGIIAEKMETTPATVRSYKFKMREKLRQAKIYSALFYLINEQNTKNLSMEGKRGTAIYEELQSLKEDIDEEEDNKEEELLSDKLKDVDLNTMNLLVGKIRPEVK
ncbi:LuxR C-terminal-related transcriptional regulator [Anaerosalibacter bizertensis]|uniref:LuxR C-terminal-related transcriptional regulator n=1 Tax=Anaerosalibacter bizertensis TaxID=932217 RepID=UPI001C0EC769|nr:LuxR C-terminal-related transcriptional regulator [Anaerosalibacter bizertensis]MBU5294281.1 LuxR C-terminal-related transcriptional regulator [Anaerosalibacter bizertensis]